MATPSTPAGFIAMLFTAFRAGQINAEAYRQIVDLLTTQGLQAAIDTARKYGLCGGVR